VVCAYERNGFPREILGLQIVVGAAQDALVVKHAVHDERQHHVGFAGLVRLQERDDREFRHVELQSAHHLLERFLCGIDVGEIEAQER
jgi:hypothetical protein